MQTGARGERGFDGAAGETAVGMQTKTDRQTEMQADDWEWQSVWFGGEEELQRRHASCIEPAPSWQISNTAPYALKGAH